MPPLELSVKVLAHYPGADLPTYATPGSAGMDLLAALEQPLEIKPMQRVLVPTGLCLAIPEGFEGQVRPRSGLALRQGITLINTPGTIDSDYRGEIQLPLINLDNDPHWIEPGQRIAQLVIASVTQAHLKQVTILEDTSRGAKGFGSTGMGTKGTP
jgi:dUTP pyrophosphatase